MVSELACGWNKLTCRACAKEHMLFQIKKSKIKEDVRGKDYAYGKRNKKKRREMSFILILFFKGKKE